MINPGALKYFAAFIERELGIVYSEQIYYQLQQRLERVADYLGVGNIESLYSKAMREGIHGEFRDYLLDISTNNETSFFRDPKIFNALEARLIPDLVKDYPSSVCYRIWSAAASFGQEPYSLAMIVHELRQKNPKFPRIEIKASDISEKALIRCRAARYSQLEIQRGLSASRLVKYFSKLEDSEWKLKPEISCMVDFEKKNLLESFSDLGRFHIILCRYVLIYQDPIKKKEILQRIVNCLQPKGYLILGGSESAMGLSNDLNQIERDGAVLYQKKEI